MASGSFLISSRPFGIVGYSSLSGQRFQDRTVGMCRIAQSIGPIGPARIRRSG